MSAGRQYDTRGRVLDARRTSIDSDPAIRHEANIEPGPPGRTLNPAALVSFMRGARTPRARQQAGDTNLTVHRGRALEALRRIELERSLDTVG